jgi:uncharacterized protein (TIRG00374 family)
MKLNWKSILKYTLSFVFALALFVYLYKDINMTDMLEKVAQTNLFWLFASLATAIISHLSRGWRWGIALKPLGYKLSAFRGFLAVMVGYLANLILPRMGEVSRCAIIKKSNNIPVNISFGTVIVERIIDLIMLALAVLITLLVEFERLNNLIINTLGEKSSSAMNAKYYLLGAFLLGIGAIVFIYLIRNKIKHFAIYQKAMLFLVGIKDGVLSLGRLTKKDIFGYVFHTLVIWLAYYGMSYFALLAMDSTANLGWSAGLIILIAGGLGMAAPVQGGVGIYHLFIAAALVAYGLGEEQGKAFAFMIHSSQLILIIIMGSLSLLWTLILKNQGSTSQEKILQ